jgi:integrase
MPDALWPTLLEWRDAGTIVHKLGKPVHVLRKPWGAVCQRAGLPNLFVPKSLRHMLATELRKRGVEKEQRELWQGHRRESTNDRYGRFDPDFLDGAKTAVNDLLVELLAECRDPIFRQVSAKRKKPTSNLRAVS